ncbi:hypothetical protein WJX77_011409 [Trebouxia sp. C0004]
MVTGQPKRNRDELNQRASTGAYQRVHADTRQWQAGTYRPRYQKHGQYSPSDPDVADFDLDSQIQRLQATLSASRQSIRSQEAACDIDNQLLQDRMEVLGDREQQVLMRELAVSKREEHTQGQQAVLKQLQLHLLQQYNAVVAELPKVEDRLNAARQLLPVCTDAAASSMKDSPAPEPASSVAPQPPQQQSASPVVSEPGHPGEHTDCLKDDAARMAATENADHMPDSSNKEAVSSLEPFEQAAGQHEHPVGSAAHPGSTQAPLVDVPSEEHEAQTPGTMSCTLLLKPLDQPPEASKDVLFAPAREAALSQQSELLQHSNCFNRDRETDSDMAVPAPNQTAYPLLSGRTGGMRSDKREAPKEALGTATVAFAPSRPVTRNQNAQQASGNLHASLPDTKQRRNVAAYQDKLSSQAISASASKAPFSSERPGLIPLRTGLRSRSDAAVNAAKVDATNRHVATEIASPNSGGRVGGRGRAFGRAGRRGRGRSNLHRTTFAQPAGDLDEAVQALKATTSNAELASSQADSGTNGASGQTDDDLKPSFMRRLAADKSPNVTLPARNRLQTESPAKERPPDDVNPRPIARRRIYPASGARQAVAKAVLQKEVPDLLDILQQKGLADHVNLLEHANSSHAQDAEGTEQTCLYDSVHTILAKACKANSWQGRIAGIRSSGVEGEESGKHEYCLLALEHLLERADAYTTASQPVHWGWCRELSSFVFVFEGANRIVVEKPCYGHATYFFDLEEPLPVSAQVQRLIAVLSVPGVSRRKVLEGSSLDPGPDLTDQERKQLEAAGWTPGTTIRSLLNFTGDRICHQSADAMTGQKAAQQNVPDYKDKIVKVLSEGASGGRVTKG